MEGHPFPDWWGVATLAVTSSTCYILNKYTPTHAPAHTYTPGPTRVSRCTLGCVPIDVRRETRWMSRPTFFFNRGCSLHLASDSSNSSLSFNKWFSARIFSPFFAQSAINSAGLIKLDQILYFSSFEWLFLRRKTVGWKKVCEPLLRFPQGWRRIGGCTCALVDVASSSQGCRGGSRPRETGTTPGATWNRGWISKPSALWSKNAVVSCTGFSAFGSWRKSLRGTKVQRRTEREGNSLCK